MLAIGEVVNEQDNTIENKINALLLNDPELTSVFVSESHLVALPVAITHFKHLKILDCSFNQLKTLPECMSEMKTLEILDLRGNEFTEIPTPILAIRSLKQLLLCRNNISVIEADTWIGIIKMIRLDLSYNDIRTLPPIMHSSSSLEHLNLSHNSLTSLPQSIGYMSSLRTLYINNNLLTSIPASTGMLINLQSLELSYNKLHSLPEPLFERMHSLQRLLLNCNPIKTVPDMSDLIALELLDISETDVEKLPLSIAKLSQLGVLYVDNPVDDCQQIHSSLECGIGPDFYKGLVEEDRGVCRLGVAEIQRELKMRIHLMDSSDGA
jgi:leucine-rich repeat protein SHOC2